MFSSKKTKDATLEAVLWKAANKLRSDMDPQDTMHVVLGLIFLKYISDQENGMTLKAREGESCVF
ncbi:MAG: type I restriction-modification system subunit M N-terminal domain-containing protein [Leptospirillum sp.]